ncbi:unnamed protein product [Callosobruchus maculatus]|uniref:FHA domain-containing protein n=1 Tax=Callosobruchus maculatus TaxID=64391 RepID=A0A653CNC4_CALMS|nr:unnamed protein product [Callosobruchus maculatus]
MDMDVHARIQVAVLKLNNREYPLYKGVNVIGRNKAATVNIVNLNVSQNHAVIIEVDETQHYISDMNSSNGTYLYGGKLKPFQLYDLNDDSHIVIGNIDARYHKLPHSIVAPNTSLQTLNSTQSMSQSMYGCNTQLITDETIVDSNTQREGQQRLRSIPPPPKFNDQQSSTNRESQPVDIHEIATQVMTYPERRSPVPPSDVHLVATQLVEEQSAGNTGIHDEETQVVDLPETTGRNSVISLPCRKENSAENEAIQTVENNLDLPNSDNDSEATNIGSQGSAQIQMMKQPVFHNRHRYHDSQEPSTSTANNHQQKIVEDSFQEANVRSSILVEDSFDNISKISDDLLTDRVEFSSGELEKSLNEGEGPVSDKPLGRQRLKFDSPQQERCESNESQSSHKKKPLNKLGSEDSDEVIVVTKKKPLRKLDSTQESDSDTDIECSPVIGESQRIKPDQKSRNPVIGCDADNNIENKENIENCNANNRPCDSDSDTEIEDEGTNTVGLKVVDSAKKGTVEGKIDSHSDKNDNSEEKKNKTKESDCATEKTKVAIADCGEPSEKGVKDATDSSGNIVKRSQTAVESDSDTDIEDNDDATKQDVANSSSKNVSGGFNESDCIPATQDAFALAFNYHQNNEKVDNDSTEDDFKLGLTELMEGGSQNSERGTRKTEGKNAPQAIKEAPEMDRIVGQRDTGNVRQSDNSIGMRARKIVVPEEEDEAYIMATQKLEIASTSAEKWQGIKNGPDVEALKGDKADGKAIAGQKVNSTTVNAQECDSSAEMKAQKIDDSEEDEAYIMATQKLEIAGTPLKKCQGIKNGPGMDTLKDDKADGKTTAGQKVNSTTVKVQESDNSTKLNTRKIDDPEEEDEAYMMATQKLEAPSDSSESKQFKMPSKKFTFKKKPLQLDQSIATMLSSQSDDMYLMATQQLKEEGASQKATDVCEDRDEDDDDVYVAATQVIERNVPPKQVDDTVYVLPTQKFPAPSEEGVEEEKDAEREPKECDVPTRAIEGDVNRPETTESGEREHVFDLPTQVSNRPETESERPKPLCLAKSLEQITVEDIPESLSQIETFIKQPFNNVEQREDVKDSSDETNASSSCTNSKVRSTRRVRRKESLDKTEHLPEVTHGKEESTTADDLQLPSTSDQIRKDMIQDIIGSVTSSKETRTRNKRKNSGDSERKETTARTTKSSKSHTKEGNDKKRRVDSPTDIQRQIRGVGKLEIKSPTERLESDSALDKNENSLCVSDSNKTGSKTNTKSSRRQRTTEQDRNVAASINGDSTGSKSAGKRNAETKSNSCSKMDVECSKRKRRTSCDSVTGGQHNDGSDERKSTKHVGSATSSSESGAERHVTANAEADDKEIRASKRATRQKSREPEPPKASASSSRRRRVSRDSDDGDGTDAAEKTATARKKRRHLHGDLEAITEMDDTAAATAAAAAASASNGDAKLVSRNKRKMESSESKVSEKMPKMDEDDLDNFCGSSSKLAKSKSGKKNGGRR